MELVDEHGRCNGQRLPVEVVDQGRHESEADHEPATAVQRRRHARSTRTASWTSTRGTISSIKPPFCVKGTLSPECSSDTDFGADGTLIRTFTSVIGRKPSRGRRCLFLLPVSASRCRTSVFL